MDGHCLSAALLGLARRWEAVPDSTEKEKEEGVLSGFPDGGDFHYSLSCERYSASRGAHRADPSGSLL